MKSSLVIDASVALKWFFEDETDVDCARALLDQWAKRETEFTVPAHWPLEVLNGVRSAIVKKRIDAKRAAEIADDFLQLRITTTDVAALLAQIFRSAVDLGRTTRIGRKASDRTPDRKRSAESHEPETQTWRELR